MSNIVRLYPEQLQQAAATRDASTAFTVLREIISAFGLVAENDDEEAHVFSNDVLVAVISSPVKGLDAELRSMR